MDTLLLGALGLLVTIHVGHAQWVTHGRDLNNRRWAETETTISPQTAPGLKLKWQVTTTSDVSATPAVCNGVVYFPDFGGMLYAVYQTSGRIKWKKSFVLDYGFPLGTYSRATPALDPNAQVASHKRRGVLVIGTGFPAHVVAVSMPTGALLWKKRVDRTNPYSVVTGAATLFGGGVYVGVSSNEEVYAANPLYKCCTFKGHVAKLNLLTGKILWRRYTLPLTGGYAGNAVWAATPSIDPIRGLVYAGVGNMYVQPPAVEQCIKDHPNRTSPDPCIEPDNKQDAIIALNVSTGAYVWTRSLGPVDAYTVSCYAFGPRWPNCPPFPGKDYDFGLNPLLMSIKDPRPGRGNASIDVAVAGQKSGIMVALDRSTGEVVWATQAGPGGASGGVSWGISTDGTRIFAGYINDYKTPFYLTTLNTTITTGAWVALDANTGQPLWYFPNSNNKVAWAMLPSVANGVVFVGSPDPKGHVYALEAASGTLLWEFSPGASVYGGVSIDSGCIYFGYGRQVSVQRPH